MKRRYLVKIIPPEGYRVYRFEFAWRHLVGLVLVAGLLVVAGGAYHLYELASARSAVDRLRSVDAEQRAQLSAIDAQAAAIAAQLDAVRRKDQEIRRAIGIEAKGRDTRVKMRDDPGTTGAEPSFQRVQARLASLARASAQAVADQERLERLALRVLDVRRIEGIARTRMLAAIPSLNPVNGSITSGFGYRTNPWPEFHPGVDLAAAYGDPVRAAAAGVVVTAGWDSGYGIKVDIDHGNRYHTWYAHLSRVDVQPGQHVVKGQIIARVGATGEATGPHLHYQVMLDGKAVDPVPYLNGIPQKLVAATR